MATPMDVETTKVSSSLQEKKRFEVKKWNAVALWAWETDTNHYGFMPKIENLNIIPEISWIH